MHIHPQPGGGALIELSPGEADAFAHDPGFDSLTARASRIATGLAAVLDAPELSAPLPIALPDITDTAAGEFPMTRPGVNVYWLPGVPPVLSVAIYPDLARGWVYRWQDGLIRPPHVIYWTEARAPSGNPASST